MVETPKSASGGLEVKSPTPNQTQNSGARKPRIRVWVMGDFWTADMHYLPGTLIVEGDTYPVKDLLKQLVYEVTGRRLIWRSGAKRWEADDVKQEQGREIAKRLALMLGLGPDELDVRDLIPWKERDAFWAQVNSLRQQKQQQQK